MAEHARKHTNVIFNISQWWKSTETSTTETTSIFLLLKYQLN